MNERADEVELPPRASSLRLLGSVVLIAAGYYAGGLVGLLFTFPPSGISVFWLSNAILLVPLLLMPPHRWWMYLIGALPMHLHLAVHFERPEPSVIVAVSQFAGNAVDVVVAALMVRPIIGTPPRFDSLRNMASFIILAGIVATAVASGVAVALALPADRVADFWQEWWQRVLAGGFPIITITPLILLAWSGELMGSRPRSRQSYADLALLVVGLLAVGIPVLGWEPVAQGNVPGLLLAPLPLLVWAAVRLGPGGVSVALLVVAGVALANGFVGRGPFAIRSSAENVLSLQIFLIAISIPLMLLSALVEERRRAEQAMKQTEARMAVAAASTDTGLWQYEVASGEFWATEHCRSMFGLDADSPLTPEALAGAAHPEDRAVVIEAMRAAPHQGEGAGRREFRVVHPNGQLRWYLVTASTEFDQNGEPVRVSGIFRDVTPRRKAEQDAEQLEDALRATRGEIARLSRQTVVGAMAASIAHEINQPLSALVTNGSIVLRLLESPHCDLDEVREILRRVIDDGHRAGQIIASVRAMFGKDSRQKSPVDISDLVREVLALAQGELKSHRVSLEVDLHDDLPRVIADRMQLQQVFLNLIMNAVEAMSSVDETDRSLLVKSGRHGARDLLITIEDSGPGIDQASMDHIFDAFFTTKSNGMGLGLSICQSIVAAHGGRIWAGQRIPHGAVFYVQLPAAISGGE